MSNASNNANVNVKRDYSHQNYCANCGTNLVGGTKFCPYCGTIVSNNVNELKQYIQAKQAKQMISLTNNDFGKKIIMTLLSTAMIWISVILSGIFAPDLVSGSQQEHLPLILWTVWIWGLIATVFALRLHRDQIDMNIFTIQTIALVGLWILVTIVSIFAPY